MNVQSPDEPNGATGRGALLAGGVAPILASTCCLGPLVLITLGFSGAWIGSLALLEPYRPIFMGMAALALTLATQDAGYPSTLAANAK